MEEGYTFLLKLDECGVCSVFVARINRACTSSIDFLIFENFSYIFTRVDRIGKRKEKEFLPLSWRVYAKYIPFKLF